MGSCVAPQCSRNRCLPRWTVWIAHRGRGGAAGRANSKKALLTGRIRVSVPFRVQIPLEPSPARPRGVPRLPDRRPLEARAIGGPIRRLELRVPQLPSVPRRTAPSRNRSGRAGVCPDSSHLAAAIQVHQPDRKAKHHPQGGRHASRISRTSRRTAGSASSYPEEFSRFPTASKRSRWRIVVPLEIGQAVQLEHCLAWPTERTNPLPFEGARNRALPI
jgi:hypothetical protein